MIKAGDVAALRGETGAGMLDCKKALEEAGGDRERARDILKKKGMAQAEKRAGRETAEGAIAGYVHHGDRVGVLVEARCETDFVARTDEFKRMARTLAMQIAVSRPGYIRREEVPPGDVEREKKILTEQAAESGKPEKVVAKIVEGKMAKFYKERCLLEQDFLISPESDAETVEDYVKEVAARLGENITIAKFSRLELGEE